MRVALVGYAKMGRVVEEVALLAARWIADRSGCHDFRDVLNDLLPVD